MLPANSASAAPGPWAVAMTGMVSLAVAMGIGRFAFTPLLPLMLNDGVIDLPSASWLASANYLGYFVGALLCTLQPWIWARFRFLPLLAFSSLVRAGLLTTCVLTLAMAWQFQPAWPWLRFAAGVTSAVVFVFTSGWCLSQLARRGRAGNGRRDLHGARRGYCGERPVRQRHGGLALDGRQGLDDFWRAGFCADGGGVENSQRR